MHIRLLKDQQSCENTVVSSPPVLVMRLPFEPSVTGRTAATATRPAAANLLFGMNKIERACCTWSENDLSREKLLRFSFDKYGLFLRVIGSRLVCDKTESHISRVRISTQ